MLVSTSFLLSTTFSQKSEISSSVQKKIPENDSLERPLTEPGSDWIGPD